MFKENTSGTTTRGAQCKNRSAISITVVINAITAAANVTQLSRASLTAALSRRSLWYPDALGTTFGRCDTDTICYRTLLANGGTHREPLQFYPALLMMRILGKDGMASAYRGYNGGFAGPDVVKAWRLYKELCDLDSFQDGFPSSTTARRHSIFRRAPGF